MNISVLLLMPLIIDDPSGHDGQHAARLEVSPELLSEYALDGLHSVHEVLLRVHRCTTQGLRREKEIFQVRDIIVAYLHVCLADC